LLAFFAMFPRLPPHLPALFQGNLPGTTFGCHIRPGPNAVVQLTVRQTSPDTSTDDIGLETELQPIPASSLPTLPSSWSLSAAKWKTRFSNPNQPPSAHSAYPQRNYQLPRRDTGIPWPALYPTATNRPEFHL
jgi:hypothetical protein